VLAAAFHFEVCSEREVSTVMQVTGRLCNIFESTFP